MIVGGIAPNLNDHEARVLDNVGFIRIRDGFGGEEWEWVESSLLSLTMDALFAVYRNFNPKEG